MTRSKHDRLFRRLYSDLDIARDALASALPPEVAALVDGSTLELVQSDSVDAAMRELRSDLVFRARLRGERNAEILVLVEHLSRPRRWTPFVMLSYVVARWSAFRREHPRARRLPLIIPIVVTHGPRGQRTRRELIDLVDITGVERERLGRYVPRLGYEVDDLSASTDDDLKARLSNPAARLALSALRDVRDATDVGALVGRWVELALAASATETGLEAVRDVVRYVLEVHQQLDVDRLAAIAATVHPFAGDEIMTTARELLDRGRAEGRAEGKAEGKAEGRRATLRRLLTLKFRSALTPRILEALAVADAETLDRWEERLLTATTLEDVLA